MAEETSFEDSRENGGEEPQHLSEFPHDGDGEDKEEESPDWLFDFGGKRRPEELRPASSSSNSGQNHEGDEDDEGESEETERGRHTGSDDDDDDVLSSFEDDPHLDTLRYEPLKPPPEIEAELQRAKMQLQRPATLLAATSGQILHSPQHFVAADRKRVSLARAQKKASSGNEDSIVARYQHFVVQQPRCRPRIRTVLVHIFAIHSGELDGDTEVKVHRAGRGKKVYPFPLKYR
ncbi:hypothetical protein FI667_g4147, partial [Globisporangium splendens]